MALADDILAAANTFAAAKIAYTAELTALVTKINAAQPITSADWTDLVVNKYDPVTAASNALRALLASLSIGIQNISDTAFQTVQQNPGKYALAGYLAQLNAHLMTGDPTTAKAMALAAYQDELTDIDNAFSTAADAAPSVVFSLPDDQLMSILQTSFGPFDVVAVTQTPPPATPATDTSTGAAS